jgi:hypothetical protein
VTCVRGRKISGGGSGCRLGVEEDFDYQLRVGQRVNAAYLFKLRFAAKGRYAKRARLSIVSTAVVSGAGGAAWPVSGARGGRV